MHYLHFITGVVFIGIVSLRYGQWLIPDTPRLRQIFFGWLFFSALLTFLLSIIYWFAEYNWITLGTCILALGIFALILVPRPRPDIKPAPKEKRIFPKKELLITVPLFALTLALLVSIFFKRTGDTLTSPWLLVGPYSFVAFGLLCVGILWYSFRKTHDKFLLQGLLIGEYLIFFSVALMIYAHGFGFDPFIHNAATEEILKHGAILPKQPYYIGQYMLTLAYSGLLGLSPAFVASLLVPIGAVICIPALLPHRTAAILFPLFPLSFFIVTTPNNLALLLAVFVVFLVWSKNPQTQIISYALALAACTIHPFIGIPLLLFIFFEKRIKTTKHLLAYAALLAVCIPVLFYLNGLRSGLPPTFQNPFFHLNNFFALFAWPHYYWFDSAPIFWKAVYVARRILVVFIIAIALYGLRSRYLIASIAGILVSSILLGAAIRFPDVVGYEQGAYALRHLWLGLVFLAPAFFDGLTRILNTVETKRIVIIALGAALLMFSWYFTYPTRDAVSKYTGFAVRDADIEAVRFIDTKNNGEKKYVVITSQSVSAAALKSFGFAKYFPTDAGPQFFYSIPTGGPLYKTFSHMVYDEPKRVWMLEAMDFVDVDTAYFVHTNYWAPAADIRDEAKEEADAWWDIGNGQLWVYEYRR